MWSPDEDARLAAIKLLGMSYSEASVRFLNGRSVNAITIRWATLKQGRPDGSIPEHADTLVGFVERAKGRDKCGRCGKWTSDRCVSPWCEF
jgi:hypothetical protein